MIKFSVYLNRHVFVMVFISCIGMSLRKHAYSNILKNLTPKSEKFQIKNSDVFHISAKNIDCGYSLEPTSTHNLCFCAEIRKIIYTPVNASFTI